MHQTVLKQPAIDLLHLSPAPAWYIDATFGGGGHTQVMLEQGAQVIAFDYDQMAIAQGEKNFSSAVASGQLILVRENFANLKTVITDLRKKGQLSPTAPIRGVLFDFGTNSDQLTSSERGLSFNGDGPLDMRLDSRLGVTAQDLLLALPEKELARLFQELGGESYARPIAREIVKLRQQAQNGSDFEKTSELVSLICRIKGKSWGKIHPATKVFQALRMAVNNEVDNLEQALLQAFELLVDGGRLVTIAFHEGEDRPCKQLMRDLVQGKQAVAITKKPLSPDPQELALNPRSRSAKLRAIEKNNNDINN